MESNTIKIISKSGSELSMSKQAASLSKYLKSNLAIYNEKYPIEIKNIEENILKYIIEYLENNNSEEIIFTSLEKLNDYSKNFLDKLKNEELIDLVVAANILDIDLLLDMLCAKISSKCDSKSENEIFEMFGINPTFTKEERDKILEDNKWLNI